MPQKCPLKVNRPKPRLYNRRLIRSGNVLELYEYGKPVMRGAVVHGSAFYGRANAPYTSAETKRENRAKIARRARETVRRTINANPQLDKFFTLTYAENLQDVAQSRKEFDVFIKRLKRLHPHLQYVCVIEFQQRGAIHFHLLCNLPYVEQRTLQSLWGHGIADIRRLDNELKAGLLVAEKYEAVDDNDLSAWNQVNIDSSSIRWDANVHNIGTSENSPRFNVNHYLFVIVDHNESTGTKCRSDM